MQPTFHPKFAIASLSLGSCAYHSLPTKIGVAGALGYDGIEIFFPDFEAFVDEVKQGLHANLFPSPLPKSSIRDLERTCAAALSTLCKSHNLVIPVIQPLRNFENFADQQQLDAALDAAERWFDLMPYFDCDLLLVCSNFIEGPHPIHSGATTVSSYLDAQVHAFRLLGERARKYGARVGYEPLAWGTVVDRWEYVWNVVQRVGMPNVGVILDSFNTLGNQYADPSTPTSIRTGVTLDAIRTNFDILKVTIPASKIFFYQIADAHRPLNPVPDLPEAPARMTWSRASRLFPCEDPDLSSCLEKSNDHKTWLWKHTGFLPVTEMTCVLHGMGYDGWWSLEVFNTSLMETDKGCPARHGERGIFGLRRLWEGTQDSIGMVKARSQQEVRLVTPPLDNREGEDTESENSELESIEDGRGDANVKIVEFNPTSNMVVPEPATAPELIVDKFEGQASSWNASFRVLYFMQMSQLKIQPQISGRLKQLLVNTIRMLAKKRLENSLTVL
ncbi:xylose isomerase-like protein [Collybia nuda]|uniref:Xylose isomerase-like protein n=1 Tax=Collybia nuda TaxID=64659 RepID=A0A9P5YDM8_9AGAR|nr:xylose isomerase-like protein [Collybia nuda]